MKGGGNKSLGGDCALLTWEKEANQSLRVLRTAWFTQRNTVLKNQKENKKQATID